MRVLICPDKFAGTHRGRGRRRGDRRRLAATAAPRRLDRSARSPTAGRASSTCWPRPLGGARIPVPTVDPLGRPVAGACCSRDDAPPTWRAPRPAGCTCSPTTERDPKRTTSYGLGALVAAAVEAGVRQVVIGLGGSATNDAGAGMLAALGAAPLDAAGLRPAVRRRRAGRVAALDGAPRRCAASRWWPPPTWTARWSARRAPARSSARRRAPARADVALLDAALARFAEVLERELPGCPPGWPSCPAPAPPAGSAPRCWRSAGAASPASGWSAG